MAIHTAIFALTRELQVSICQCSSKCHMIAASTVSRSHGILIIIVTFTGVKHSPTIGLFLHVAHYGLRHWPSICFLCICWMCVFLPFLLPPNIRTPMFLSWSSFISFFMVSFLSSRRSTVGQRGQEGYWVREEREERMVCASQRWSAS